MDKSEAKRQYKEAKRPMGVFAIINNQTETCFLGTALDVAAGINRHRSELRFGGHRNRELLAQWKAQDGEGFEFTELDQLEQEEDSQADPREELKLLREMLVSKMEEKGYRVVLL